jgi:flagellar protein FlbB
LKKFFIFSNIIKEGDFKMKAMKDKIKVIYLVILLVFIILVGFFWLDYIGMINITKTVRSYFKSEPQSVLDTAGDEPSLIEREEFEKQKEKLTERIEDLDRREASIVQTELEIEKEHEKIEETRKGLELEKERINKEKNQFSGYKKNVKDLSNKITSMQPEKAIDIILEWEDPMVIDVLRQIDTDAAREGKMSISSYLISLMPKERASRITYLMTQL